MGRARQLAEIEHQTRLDLAEGSGQTWELGIPIAGKEESGMMNPYLTNVPGGVVDLRYGDLEVRDWEAEGGRTAGRFRRQDYAALRELLALWLEPVFDQENFDLLCRAIGVTMAGRKKAGKTMVVLRGQPCSGKTATLTLLKEAFGGYGLTVHPEWLAARSRQGFDETLAEVLERQTRLILAGDQDGAAQSVQASAKRVRLLTGVEELTARRPRSDNALYGRLPGIIWMTTLRTQPWMRYEELGRRMFCIATKGPLRVCRKGSDYPQDLLDAVVTVGIREAADFYHVIWPTAQKDFKEAVSGG